MTVSDAQPHRVEITGKYGYDTTVRVNGRLMPCTYANLRIDPDGYPELRLDLPVHDGVVISLDGVVRLGGETRAALLSMGWTPPAEAG